MVVTLLLTSAGFLVIFIAVRGYSQVSFHSDRSFVVYVIVRALAEGSYGYKTYGIESKIANSLQMSSTGRESVINGRRSLTTCYRARPEVERVACRYSDAR